MTDPASHTAMKRRRYRRFVIVFSIIGGVAVGVGLGSVAAIADAWGLLLLLVLPLGLRFIGVATGRVGLSNQVVWLWPPTGLPVALAAFLLVPRFEGGGKVRADAQVRLRHSLIVLLRNWPRDPEQR